MASVPVNKIGDHYQLTCGICQDTYSNPKVLPCLHSFCQNCLDSSIRAQDRSLQCPICQVSIPVPAKGIEAFPLNFFVNNMLTVLAVRNPTKCTNCEDSAQASARCLDCVENLCAGCVYAHKRIRQTKEHRILSFEEIQANEVKDIIRCPSFCKTHPREVLKYYCESCDEAVCRDCAIYEHREHVYVDLKEAVKKYRSAITSLLDRTKRKIPQLKGAVDELLEVRESLVERADLVRESIRKSIRQHIRELEDQEKELLDRLDSVHLSKEKVLTTQQELLGLDLANLLSSCEFTENVLRYGNEAEVMLVKPQMVSRLKYLNAHESHCEPEDNDIVDFYSNDDELSHAISKLGHVSTSLAFPPLSCAEGPGLIRAKVGHKTSFTVFAKDRNGEPCTYGGDPVTVKLHCFDAIFLTADVEDNQDGSYTVTYSPVSKGILQLTVHIRDKPIRGSPFELPVTSGIDCEKIGPMIFKCGRRDGLPDSSEDTCEPWGVTVGPDGRIIVSDHHNHRLQVFDANGQSMYQFATRGKSEGEIWYPAGVCCSRNGDIYVADHGNHRVQVFTQDGKFVSKFGSRGSGPGQLKGPCGLALDSQDRLIVADRDNHRIQIFDSEGQPIANFGSYGDADGKFSCPRHVAVTQQDEILVSDAGNFRVQMFDKNGAFLFKFGGKGSNKGQFGCPAGIAMDSEEHIAVADLKNVNLQIFDSKGNFVKRVGEQECVKKGSAVFNKPTGLAISANGNVVVADRGNHRVQVF